MKFKRLGSDSKPRPKRFRILKRKPKAQLFDWDADKQWLWAAYRHGKAGFAEDTFPDGLSQDEFDAIAEKIVESIDFPYLMKGYVKDRGVIPVGLAATRIVQYHVEPHLFWFWWATPRNKYEATFKFFDKLAEDAPFVIAVEKDGASFRLAEHLKKAGIMRRVGTSYNWEPDKIMALYETRDG